MNTSGPMYILFRYMGPQGNSTTSALGLRVSRFRVSGFRGFRVSGFRLKGIGFRVSGFRFKGLGFRVSGFRV